MLQAAVPSHLLLTSSTLTFHAFTNPPAPTAVQLVGRDNPQASVRAGCCGWVSWLACIAVVYARQADPSHTPNSTQTHPLYTNRSSRMRTSAGGHPYGARQSTTWQLEQMTWMPSAGAGGCLPDIFSRP